MPVPEIKDIRTIATSRFFRIEELDLEFANGEQRTYERLPGSGSAAVMVVPITDQGEILLIREYAAGFHEIQHILRPLTRHAEGSACAPTRLHLLVRHRM